MTDLFWIKEAKEERDRDAFLGGERSSNINHLINTKKAT